MANFKFKTGDTVIRKDNGRAGIVEQIYTNVNAKAYYRVGYGNGSITYLAKELNLLR